MKLFQNEILSQAIRLRSQTAILPDWLQDAQLAFSHFEQSSSTPESIDALATRLAQIPNWPESISAMESSLDQLASPVIDMASRAFCRVTTNNLSEPTAYIWGDEARIVAAKKGIIYQSGSQTDPSQSVESLKLEQFFAQTPWNAAAPGTPSVHTQIDSKHLQARQAANHALLNKRLTADLSNSAAVLDDIMDSMNESPLPARRASDQSPSDSHSIAQQRASERLTSARTQGGFFPQVLLMTNGSLIDAQEYATDGMPEDPSATPLKTMHYGSLHVSQRDFSNDFGRGLLDLQRNEIADRAWSDFSAQTVTEKQKLSQPLHHSGAHPSNSSAPLAGLQRGTDLLSSLDALGHRSLAKARAQAGERLVSFIQTHSPDTTLANELSQRLWGTSLSLQEAQKASSWVPHAKEWMRDDPRGALLGFAIAPALGISPSSEALKQTEEHLKEHGISDSVLRVIKTLPEQAFNSLTAEFSQSITSNQLNALGHQLSMAFDLTREGYVPFAESIHLTTPGLNAGLKNKLPDTDLSAFQNFAKTSFAPLLKDASGLQGQALLQLQQEQQSANVLGPRILNLAYQEMKGADADKQAQVLNQLDQVNQWISQAPQGVWQAIAPYPTWNSLVDTASAMQNVNNTSAIIWKPLDIDTKASADQPFSLREIRSISELVDQEVKMKQALSPLLFENGKREPHLFVIQDQHEKLLGVASLNYHLAGEQASVQESSKELMAYISHGVGVEGDRQMTSTLQKASDYLVDKADIALNNSFNQGLQQNVNIDFRKALQSRREDQALPSGPTVTVKPNSPKGS